MGDAAVRTAVRFRRADSVSPNCSATSTASRATRPSDDRLSRSRRRCPVGRRDEVDTSLEPVPHALEQAGVHLRGLADRRDQRLERVGVYRAPRHIPRDHRDAATARALEGERRILGDERLHAQPDHRRQILIGGILGVRQQRARDVPAGGVIQALQRGRQVEPHDRRAFVASHAREDLDRVRRRRAILAEQLNRPGADVLVADPTAPRRGRRTSSRR